MSLVSSPPPPSSLLAFAISRRWLDRLCAEDRQINEVLSRFFALVWYRYYDSLPELTMDGEAISGAMEGDGGAMEH